MAGKEFLESIEINFKQAIKFLKINKKNISLNEDISEQNIQTK